MTLLINKHLFRCRVHATGTTFPYVNVTRISLCGYILPSSCPGPVVEVLPHFQFLCHDRTYHYIYALTTTVVISPHLRFVLHPLFDCPLGC